MDEQLTALAQAVGPHLDAVADIAVGRMIAEARSYHDHRADELRPVVLGNLAASLADVTARPDALRDQRHAFRQAGRTRALQGVSIDDMLHGWRIGVEELRIAARAQASALGLPDSVVLAFTDRCLAWADRGMLESTAEHRRTELDLARREQHVRANLVRQILHGALGGSELRVQVLAYGLELGELYHPFRVAMPAGVDVRAVERVLGVADGAGPRRGLAALIDGDLAGFTSRLPSSAAVARAGAVVAGVGPAASLDALAHAFTLASRALDAARATGRTGLVPFASLGVLPAVQADEDVTRPLCDAILGPLRCAGPAGEVILHTVRCYLDHDRRLAETAADLHAHVNTVRNRLDRFAQLTGRDLHRTDALVEVWWVLQTEPGSAGRAD